MKKTTLKVGDVVQISPDSANEIFRGCLLIVTEPKDFGCMGYVQIPGQGQAYLRPRWDEMELVGKAKWVVGPND